MISERARHAIHGIAFLAQRPEATPTPFSEILSYLRDYSGDLWLSAGYVRKVLQDLALANIVRALTGPGGGYVLARPPGDVGLTDMLDAIDGLPNQSSCPLCIGPCALSPSCRLRRLVRKAEGAFHSVLENETAESISLSIFPARRKGGTARGQQARRKAATKRSAPRRRMD